MRLGGDEFVVISTLEHGKQEIEQRVAEFMKKLPEYYALDPELVKLSAGAGIAFSETPSESLDLLMQQTDRALCQAKIAGRGCCYVYHPGMNVQDDGESILVNEMV